MVVIRVMLALALAAGAVLPAQAQDGFAELDALSAATEDPASGLSLARQQIGDGDLTGAAATLERLLMDNPGADQALVLHATLLCRLDDKEGGRGEIAAMDGGIRIDSAAWNELTAACGAMPRPGGN